MTLLNQNIMEDVEELQMALKSNVVNAMELVSMENVAPVIWTTMIILTIGPNVQ